MPAEGETKNGADSHFRYKTLISASAFRYQSSDVGEDKEPSRNACAALQRFFSPLLCLLASSRACVRSPLRTRPQDPDHDAFWAAALLSSLAVIVLRMSSQKKETRAMNGTRHCGGTMPKVTH